MVKIVEKEKAIEWRKKGATYSEILKEVPVSKSTLSLWLKKVGLSVPQKQRITEKRLAAQIRGALAKKQIRIDLVKQIKNEASAEIGHLNEKVFWMVGAALYWAEGSKQKEHSVSSPVIFSNSDAVMIKFFYKWLVEVCKIQANRIYFEIYTHENCNPEAAKIFWSKTLNLDLDNFEKIRFKKDKGNSYRKNKGENYHGLLRIRVRNSTNLNRQIMGWVEGLSRAFLNYNINSEVV